MSSGGDPKSPAEIAAETDSRMADLNLQDEQVQSSSSPYATRHDSPSAELSTEPFQISNNAPGFKYKYPQAKPTPPGVDDTEWNKIYTAADSRNYNKHNKSANESKKYRERGDTYELALKMLEEKREKANKAASGDGPPRKPKPAVIKKTEAATVKKEPSSGSRDGTPAAEKLMGIAEKIKSEGRARKPSSVATSSDRGTPAPTVVKKASSPGPPPVKADKPPKKKGTAAPVKKTAPKSKLTEHPESNRKSSTPGPRSMMSSGESSDNGGEYCICRGPDDHRMMVCCEGGCEEWYHCECVNINVADAKELLDVYICPKCQTEEKFTTWKRMCRYYNVGKHEGFAHPCRRAARVNTEPPSKYCSDECKKLFWEFVKSQVRDDDEPSRGGALSQKEVGFILKQAKNAEEVHALGAKPRLPKKEGSDPGRLVGLDYLTPDEQQEIEEIQTKKAVIDAKIKGYQDQQKVLLMVNKRAKIAAQQPNLEVKDICGYDNRLSFNEAQFARWVKTNEGVTALQSGVLGPRTDETKDIGAVIPFPGQPASAVTTSSEALNNICLKKMKKCKHAAWREVHNQDYVYNQRILKDEFERLSKLETELIDDAETREATKDYYADNVTEQLF